MLQKAFGPYGLKIDAAEVSRLQRCAAMSMGWMKRKEAIPELQAVLVKATDGPVRVAWRREGGRFTLDTEIPPNTTATVALPDGTRHECGSGRRRLSCAAGS